MPISSSAPRASSSPSSAPTGRRSTTASRRLPRAVHRHLLRHPDRLAGASGLLRIHHPRRRQQRQRLPRRGQGHQLLHRPRVLRCPVPGRDHLGDAWRDDPLHHRWLEPTPSYGTVYSGPIDITTTTTVRAIAYLGGWLADQRRYPHLHLRRRRRPAADRPARLASRLGATTQRRQRPVRLRDGPARGEQHHGLGVHTVPEALLDIPTVSIAMPQNDFTGPS